MSFKYVGDVLGVQNSQGFYGDGVAGGWRGCVRERKRDSWNIYERERQRDSWTMYQRVRYREIEIVGVYMRKVEDSWIISKREIE